jgi:hypothetical protein
LFQTPFSYFKLILLTYFKQPGKHKIYGKKTLNFSVILLFAENRRNKTGFQKKYKVSQPEGYTHPVANIEKKYSDY